MTNPKEVAEIYKHLYETRVVTVIEGVCCVCGTSWRDRDLYQLPSALVTPLGYDNYCGYCLRDIPIQDHQSIAWVNPAGITATHFVPSIGLHVGAYYVAKPEGGSQRSGRLRLKSVEKCELGLALEFDVRPNVGIPCIAQRDLIILDRYQDLVCDVCKGPVNATESTGLCYGCLTQQVEDLKEDVTWCEEQIEYLLKFVPVGGPEVPETPKEWGEPIHPEAFEGRFVSIKVGDSATITCSQNYCLPAKPASDEVKRLVVEAGPAYVCTEPTQPNCTISLSYAESVLDATFWEKYTGVKKGKS